MIQDPLMDARLSAAARKVRLLLMDCDGVLTDGRLYLTASGEEMKVFHVRDGQGIAFWHAHGFESGIISGRGAAAVLERRARELGMAYLKTSSADKSADLDRILSAAGADESEVAYIGDDTADIPVLRRVGFPVAVADCAHTLLDHVVWRTVAPGGRGAVRELVDLLLRAKE